jgi:hypothetical protein
MKPQPLALTESGVTTLSLACLAHMQQEEAMLAETLESLEQVRTALRGGGIDALKDALDRQTRIAHASAELRDRRAKLRRQMSAVLGVAPHVVTIKMLAARLPGEAGARLASCRDRLNEMAARVDRVNRANAALVGQSLDFLERFFIEITGGERDGTGYGPAGDTREPALGSIIEARG